MFRKSLILGLLCALSLSTGLGRNALELQSSYVGDGWFQYRLRTLEDPFFTGFTFYQLTPWPFTNYVESTLPPHWTNFLTQRGSWSGIMFDESAPQPRINEINFAVRSTSTSFKRAQYAFAALSHVQFADCYSSALQITAQINLDCLVPCAPDEADGSPPTFICPVELVPDLKIDQLVLTNGNIYGLTFSWTEPSTVQLEASHDLTNWTKVARFYGDPPHTTWTTNTPLNAFGEFLRLSLVANDHLPNTLAATPLALVSPRSLDIPVTIQNPTNNQATIGFASVPKATYEVDCYERPGKIIATQRTEATNAYTTLSFDLGEPRRAVYFKARQLPN